MPDTNSVLFICTANQCRSPMAEALLRRKLENEHPEWNWLVASAGTWAEAGYPATPYGVKAMAEVGLDTSAHKSQLITQELLDRFSLILTMEAGHKEAIQIEFPDIAKRVYMLSEMSGEMESIKDPIGGSFAEYQNTAKEINEWIDKGLPYILDLLNARNNLG